MILEYIVKLFAPFCCLECGAETDRLACETCLASISRVPSRCYLCRAATRQYTVCSSCRPKTPLRQVFISVHHDGLAKELIHAAKYERAYRGLYEMADVMSEHLPLLHTKTVFVPVPTATSRVRERGYDQAVVLAQRLARHSGLPCRQYLVRLGQAHQVGASRAKRISHMRGAFRVVRALEIKNARIVLIDDVCTTGATLEAAARALRQAGAKQVDALVFAQPN